MLLYLLKLSHYVRGMEIDHSGSFTSRLKGWG
jgi:hypothetical protein